MSLDPEPVSAGQLVTWVSCCVKCDRWSLLRWRLVVIQLAHRESKDDRTKAQSFLSAEENGDQLELSILARKATVQGSQRQLP